MKAQPSLRASVSDERYLAALRTYWKRHQTFPSMGRLAVVTGLAQATSVFEMVGRLVQAEYLERVDGRIVPSKKLFARPVWGTVRAGQPQPQPQGQGQGQGQDQQDVLTLDDYLIDDPNCTGLVTVRGDSMRDAGLLNGDLVAVESNAPTKPGDIVVAVVDGELTIKTLRLAPTGRHCLEADDPAYADIYRRGRSKSWAWLSAVAGANGGDPLPSVQAARHAPPRSP